MPDSSDQSVLSTDQGTLWVVCKIQQHYLSDLFIISTVLLILQLLKRGRVVRIEKLYMKLCMKLYAYVLNINCLTVFGKTLKPTIQIMAFSLPWNSFRVKPWENYLIHRFLIGGLTPRKSHVITHQPVVPTYLIKVISLICSSLSEHDNAGFLNESKILIH